MTSKAARHAAILELVRQHRISSQEGLRELLSERDFDVTQATLSRDIRELRLVKVPDAEGHPYYALPPETWEQTPSLEQLLPALYVDSEGAGNLLIVRTLTGGAQPVAVAIDWEEWPEVLGTIAGDDTILVILRQTKHLVRVQQRLRQIAGVGA
jgi:transcriptional regulator of arginine metabolism